MRKSHSLVALCLAACAPVSSAAMREHIGGAARARAFASPTAYEAYLRAEASAARGDHDGALRQLELAELADPTDGYLTARRAEVLLASGDVAGARGVADDVTRARPELSAGWLVLAECLARGGDAEGAMRAVARATALDPDDPDVRATAASVAGGDARAAAAARVSAAGASPGDHNLAARAMALDPADVFRRSAAARRRQRASELAERGDWAAVDRALSPLAQLDPTRVHDRVRVIEARARDGRAGDAAALVSGLRVGEGAGRVRAVERARLWLVAGRPAVAAEEARAALRDDPDDPLARRVLGHALLRAGAVAEGLGVLAEVDVDQPAGALLVVSRDALTGAFEAGMGDVPGEGVDAPGVAFALARIEAAAALDRAGLEAAADRVLGHALAALSGGGHRGARDRVRVEVARRLAERGALAASRESLAGVETAWGQHRRAAMLALTEPFAAVRVDLDARTGDALEDAAADAWWALACGLRGGACDERGMRERVGRAASAAPTAPVTLRARSVMASDRREAAELARRAAALDPASPGAAALRRTRGGSDATR